MRALSYVAMFSFLGGLSLLVAGFLLRGSPEPLVGTAPFDIREADLTTAPTATLVGAPTATAAPRPFDGKVARIVAEDIGVDHGIGEVGLVDNQLDVPKDGVNKVGWYSIYDQPGHGGNALFAAHVNFDRKNGPFAGSKTVTEGTRISIVMEGGPTYVYSVVVYQQYDADSFPTGDLIVATGKPENEEWITLITCGGRFVPDPGSEFGHYEQRDVVIARRIE